MDHSIRKLVWVSGLLAAASFVYVLVFSPLPDPRDRARSAHPGTFQETGSLTLNRLNRDFREAFAQCQYNTADRISREMVQQYTHEPVSWFNRAILMDKLERSADAFNAWSTLMHQLGSMPTITSRAASHAAYYRGWALRGMGASEQSVEYFTKAMQMYEASLAGREPTRDDAYNLACYASLAGETDQAIGHWAQALETGYRDGGSWWMMDPDLDPIRADERFRAIAREHRLTE